MLVADALYAFAQSAEAREAELKARASAAEALACRERAAGARRAAALAEAEGLVAQVRAVAKALKSRYEVRLLYGHSPGLMFSFEPLDSTGCAYGSNW